MKKTKFEVSSVILREELSHYLNLVCYGKNEVIVTRRGKPLAKLTKITEAINEDS